MNNTNEVTPEPEISILVPVYHVEKTLRKALDSILNQTFTDFEIILINDGGTPEETAICEEYAEKDKRIVYVRQSNQGLSAVRNLGLTLCRGKWIMFLDSDDWMREDCFAKAWKSVSTTGADIGIFDLMYTDGSETEGVVHRSGLPAGVHSGSKALEGRIRGDIQCYVWNKIYRAGMWDRIIFPLREVYGDDAVIHEVLDKARTVAVIHDVLVYKLNRSDNITSIAVRDRTSAYWLYHQRRRRYEYLVQHHPELLPLAAENTVKSLLVYCRVCLLFTGDRDGMEEARRWARGMKFPIRSIKWHTQIRYFLLQHSIFLFTISERMILLLKKDGII